MADTPQPKSLADFISGGTDNIAVLTSRLPAQGIFIVQGKESKRELLAPKTPEQDEMLKILISSVIMSAAPLDKNLNPDELVGKNINDTRLLTSENFGERMGLLKGDYQKIGLPNVGELGGLPEQKGWLDGIIDWPFQIRVRHVTGKTGSEIAYLDYSRISDPKVEAEVFTALGLQVPAARPTKAA